MELSRQEMELILPLPVIRKQNFVNRKWRYFSYLWSSDQKTSLIKVSSFCLTILKCFLETIALFSLFSLLFINHRQYIKICSLFTFIAIFHIGTTGLFIISQRIFASIKTGTSITVALHSPIAGRTCKLGTGAAWAAGWSADGNSAIWVRGYTYIT